MPHAIILFTSLLANIRLALKNLSGDKHSSLLLPNVGGLENKFYSVDQKTKVCDDTLDKVDDFKPQISNVMYSHSII